MTDKVQKIREEIEKIKTIHSSVGLKESNPDILVVQVCTNLLSFIDSLQEEPVELKEVDLEKEVDTWRHNHFHSRRDKNAAGEYLKRSSQLDIAKYFFELGITVGNKSQKGNSMTDKEKKRLHDIQNVPVDEEKLKMDRSNTL